MDTDISISKLKLLGDKINLIDIRDEKLFNQGRILKAKNIPIYKLLSDSSFYLKEDECYYLYCEKGYSSTYVCKMLAKEGYQVVNIIGGYRAWQQE